MKTIKQVSKLSGASVRTLQYYDNIHLLTPSRTESSYRLYSDDDIAKLQQILFLKALGFSLKEIRELINRPDFDHSLVFRKQKELLCAQRQQVGKVIRVLERLENGASLDDCAADIKSIYKEPKHMKKSLKLFIILAVVLAGAFGVYQTLQLSQPEADAPTTIGADVININSVVADGANKCHTFDLAEITVADLPNDSPALEQLALPEDLRSNLRLEKMYKTDDQTINYSIKSSQNQRYIYIGFSPDGTPPREMYAPEGKPSIINGHEVMMGHYVGTYYVDEFADFAPLEKYYIDFKMDDMNYTIEAHDFSETEVITLIKSLL